MLRANITSVRALTIRYHTGQHVNVIVCRRSGAVHRDERLPAKSYSIDAALNKKATQVDQSVLVKGWCLISVLCV